MPHVARILLQESRCTVMAMATGCSGPNSGRVGRPQRGTLSEWTSFIQVSPKGRYDLMGANHCPRHDFLSEL